MQPNQEFPFMQNKDLMSGQSVAHLVGKVRRAFNNHLNRSYAKAGYNITVEQFVVLVILWNGEGITQQKIAGMTGKDKTSITRLLNNMEKNGLIKRQKGTRDKRQKIVCLTEYGNTIKEPLIVHTQQNIAVAGHGISQEKMDTCKEVLNKMYENLLPR